MRIYREGAITVAQLKKALEGIPDDALVGKSMLDTVGHVEIVNDVKYCKEYNIVTIDSDRHTGSFTEDELDSELFELRPLV